MTFQCLAEVVSLAFRAISIVISTVVAPNSGRLENVLVIPYLQQIVAATGNESPLLTWTRVRADQATGRCCWGPADRVHAHSMSVEDLMSPAVVAELEDTHMPVRRSASKETSALVWSPGNHIHRGSVEGEIENFCPGAACNGGCRVLVLFTPDKHFSVVRRGGQNRAKLGVSLRRRVDNILAMQTRRRLCVKSSNLPMPHTTPRLRVF
jgi:hypothetical protein